LITNICDVSAEFPVYYTLCGVYMFHSIVHPITNLSVFTIFQHPSDSKRATSVCAL